MENKHAVFLTLRVIILILKSKSLISKRFQESHRMTLLLVLMLYIFV
jgi:hypothetical protein